MVYDFIQKYYSFIKFCIVAVGYNLFAYLIFVIFILLDINYLVASTIAFILGVVLSLYMNKTFVFDSSNYSKGLIIRYFVFYILLLSFNLVMLHILVDKTPVNVYLSQIIVTGISAVVSFNVMKAFVFK
ncbi:gtrA-like family protein [Francisella frigiditurris]|uniref:GtrA-like family protein n=2 Tax=Francisella frigiditurris TaxID=1542390 RepID=A0A1J0KUX6_9GAMM|nr:gtrA-like family protein [Francisella frigiditurris]